MLYEVEKLQCYSEGAQMIVEQARRNTAHIRALELQLQSEAYRGKCPG